MTIKKALRKGKVNDELVLILLSNWQIIEQTFK